MSAVAEGDVGELYGALAPRLSQIVRADVRAPEVVIEDACQFAWSRLVFHAHRIRRETALPWLVSTAVHQAVKLARRDDRELSLEALLDRSPEPLVHLRAPGPEELVDQRERLAAVTRLPPRQQRLVWLQAIGLSYNEMAATEGDSVRTVERQLLRAKQTMRAVGSD